MIEMVPRRKSRARSEKWQSPEERQAAIERGRVAAMARWSKPQPPKPEDAPTDGVPFGTDAVAHVPLTPDMDRARREIAKQNLDVALARLDGEFQEEQDLPTPPYGELLDPRCEPIKLRLERGLKKAVRRASQEKGWSNSRLLAEALEQYLVGTLGMPTSADRHPTGPDQLEQAAFKAQQALADLRRQVAYGQRDPEPFHQRPDKVAAVQRLVVGMAQLLGIIQVEFVSLSRADNRKE